ncbi:MAG: hypothetical protein AAB525_03070 [Patescibacteria group bacterium]
MENQISKLVLNAHQQNSELEISISNKDEQLGQILILAQITKTQESNKNILKQIIDETKKDYFSSVAQDSEKALEDSLQKLNFRLSETIKETKKEWLKYSKVIIAACHKEFVHFSKIGPINVLLTSEKNVVEITENNNEEINPVKIFANIYSGTMPQNSTVALITDTLLDYISQEKLKKIVLDNNLSNAIAELKSVFNKAPSNKSFGAILIKRDSEEKKEADIANAQNKAPIKKEPIIQKQNKIKTAIIIPKRQSKQKSRGSLFAKITALVIAVVSFMLLFNILFPGKNKQSSDQISKEDTQYQILLNSIQAKIIEARNFLIISDRKQAETALKQAQNTISGLPEDNSDQVNQKQKLIKEITTQLLLAQGVNLAAPRLLAEIPNFIPNQILLRENNIYTFDGNGGVYKLNLSNNIFAKLETASAEIGILTKAIDHSGNTLLFYHSLDGLAQLNLETNKMQPLQWDRTWSGEPSTSDIYQNKLYLVTTGVSYKLLKYTASTTGFTQEVEWITDSADFNLADTADMAIDGSIWLLQKSGQIIKLFKNKKEGFSPQIQPPLQRPTKIFTDLDLKYIYVLDPPTLRVVILNKEGALINQLTAQEFSDLRDMAVDETARKIYLLDETNIFEVGF